MKTLTQRQQDVLQFIERTRDQSGVSPSLREIAGHFGFRSMKAAADHVSALKRKGALSGLAGRARALSPNLPHHKLQKQIVNIPLLGAIPAGLADNRSQEVEGCVSVDISSIGIRPTARTFALRVQGDSMIGRHILSGDIVVLEHGQSPRPGDVVAALIDNESTLKTYLLQRGKPFLRAENPRYPDLIPAQELVIQGVMKALIRKIPG